MLASWWVTYARGPEGAVAASCYALRQSDHEQRQGLVVEAMGAAAVVAEVVCG